MNLTDKGYCQCGCGELTRIATKTVKKFGHVKGAPLRYIYGHSTKHSHWMGGKIKQMGYVAIRMTDHPKSRNGYVFEHILVAEQMNNGPLPPKAVVHHINGIKDDNRPENLMICADQAEHKAIHRKQLAFAETGNESFRKCKFCKTWDAPENMVANGWSMYHKKCQADYDKKRTIKTNA